MCLLTKLSLHFFDLTWTHPCGSLVKPADVGLVMETQNVLNNLTKDYSRLAWKNVRSNSYVNICFLLNEYKKREKCFSQKTKFGILLTKFCFSLKASTRLCHGLRILESVA